MESEESVEVHGTAFNAVSRLRNRNRRANTVIIFFSERHDDIQSVGGATGVDPHATMEQAIQMLLGGQVSQETRDTLAKQMDDPQILQATLDDKVKQVNVGMIAGLVLGSPEFQRR